MTSTDSGTIRSLRRSVNDYASSIEKCGRRTRGVIEEADLQLRRLYESIDRALDDKPGGCQTSAARLRRQMELVKERSKSYETARRDVLVILDGQTGDAGRVTSYLVRLGRALDEYLGIEWDSDGESSEGGGSEPPGGEWPDFKAPRIPTEKTGRFLGTPGDSAFVPHSEAARSSMSLFGKDHVEYRGGYPDFAPFCMHETPFGIRVDCQVEIGHMTTARENPSWEFGRRPTGSSHDASYDLGNFAQADLELANLIISKGTGSAPSQGGPLNADREALASAIEAWRRRERLTWHEVQDGRTMQLVPEAIHIACPHTGGVSVMDVVQQYGDVDRAFPGEDWTCLGREVNCSTNEVIGRHR